MKYKVGDLVKVVRSDDPKYNDMIGKTGQVTQTEPGTTYPYLIDGVDSVWCDEELELIKESNMYKQGDVLVNDSNNYGYKRIVQGMIGDIVFTIDSDDDTVRWQSPKDLEHYGWHLETETTPTELTIDQIAEKFNLKPEEVRIKKDD